jgi:drug/metabolite transporter (DMT)-like permease
MLLGLRAQSLPQLANPGAIAAIVATGVFVYFLSALTWYGAINLLSLAWTTALVVPGIPLLAMLFALMFLGEPITMRELGGIAIAIVGVLILVLGAEPHRMVPDAEAAEAIHQPIN